MMIQQSDTRATDPEFANLIEQLSQALDRGEQVRIDHLASEYPQYAADLRRVWPVLEVMRQLSLAEVTRQPDTDGPNVDERSSSGGTAICRAGNLGDFRILRELGRGGMGVVYEAEQISLNRHVALKVLPFAAMLDQRQLQRFKNEATAAAQLKHPNIVSVYSVGHDRGVHYYAMEYIEGATLADLIAQQASQRRGVDAVSGEPAATEASDEPPVGAPQAEVRTEPLAALSTVGSIKSEDYFRTVAQIGIQAAEALEHAHLLGVVHRDIKPANLLRDTEGNVWVTDFGLAQVETEAGLTMTGDVLGTLRYMSPEQALGKRGAVDYRTDIYGLGVTLYELLTLRPAFPQSDRAKLLRQVADEEPPAPREHQSAIPRDLETVVLKAMAKQPADRYGSAQAFADDLQRFLEHKPIQARRPTTLKRLGKWSQRHRTIITAVTAATILCLILASVLLWRERNSSEIARIESDEARIESEENVRLALTVLDDIYLDMLGERMARGQEVSKQDRELLNKGLAFYLQFVERAGARPELRLEMARAYRQAGMIYQTLGHHKSEEQAFRSAAALYEELLDESPDTPAYRFPLALVLGSLAQNQARSGRNDEAQRAGLRSIEILQQLCAHDPGEPRYTMALADTHNRFGLMLTRILLPSEIERHHRIAIELFEKLVRDFSEAGSREAAFQEALPFQRPGDGLVHSTIVAPSSS